MKKILGLIVFIFGFSCAQAQTTETKVKPKTTVGDRVHNTIHPRRARRHHGYKVKRKTERSAYLRPKETDVKTT